MQVPPVPEPSAALSLPGWLKWRTVSWIGNLAGLLVIAIGVASCWHEYRELVEGEIRLVEVDARVLQDQVDRNLDTLDVNLRSVDDAVRIAIRGGDPINTGDILKTSVQGMPFVRSLSLLDDQGRVLASSESDNIDRTVPGALLPLPSSTSRRSQLGALLAGRDLADAGPMARITAAAPHHFLPVRHPVHTPMAAYYLVAALNVEYFGNQHPLLLGNEHRGTALLTPDGILLSTSASMSMMPGRAAPADAFFRKYLPRIESGSGVVRGLDGRDAISGFRMSRNYPIVALVEQDPATLHAEFGHTMAWVAAGCGTALAGLVVAMLAAQRSLRGMEEAQRQVASSRGLLEARERELRELVDSVQEVVFRTDSTGRLTFVNGRWGALRGGGHAGSIVGRRFGDVCDADDPDAIDRLFDPADRAPRQCTVRLRAKDGAALDISVSPVVSETGGLIGYAGFAVDVSDRELARERLETQLRLTSRLLEASPSALFVKSEGGVYENVNAAWIQLFGIGSDAIIGRTTAEVFGSQAPLHEANDAMLIGTEGRLVYECQYRRNDGEVRDLIVHKVAFNNSHGHAAGVIGCVTDVTTFKAVEREIISARNKAERANHDKSEFIAQLTHELRTPLQAILGFADIGRHRSVKTPSFATIFQEIMSGGHRLLRLVNELLEVARIENRQMSFALQPVPLAPLVEEVCRELQPIAGRKEVALRLDDVDGTIIGSVDPTRIQQVVRNVLANAIRFSSEGSTVDLRIGRRNEHEVEIRVRDHGPGIPVDEIESIFEPFVQSTRTAPANDTTGLGLTICRKIMAAHGGRIYAANAPGGGAEFLIVLPQSLGSGVPPVRPP